MVANINKLKGKITENEYTFKTLSEELGMCETTLRRKINDKNAEFTISEGWKLKNKLKMSIEEYLNIFYDEKSN